MSYKGKRQWFWLRQKAVWEAALTLAAWRWRTQRFLWCAAGLGVLVAVVLLSSLPLFSSVMTTAGLRAVARAQPDSSQLLAHVTLPGISSAFVAADAGQVDQLIQQDVGRYFPGQAESTLITGSWNGSLPLDFYGVPVQTVSSHLRLLQGHLPVANTSSINTIDVMLTRTAALYMGHLKVGDTVPLGTDLLTNSLSEGGMSYTNTIYARVVGIFQVQPNDPYWDGYTLEEPPPVSGVKPQAVYALSDSASLLHMLDAINQHQGGQGIYFADGTTSLLLLSYTLNTSMLTGGQLADVITKMGVLQRDIAQTFQGALLYSGVSDVSGVSLSGSLIHDPVRGTASALEKYQSQVQIIQTPLLIITVQILCLILFFVSVIVGMLVEREQVAIAVLRSRGANRRQVSGSLIVQGAGLCVLAGLLGPWLAFGLVYVIVPHLLTATTRDAFNALALDFQPLLRAVSLYTLAAVVVVFLTLLLTIFLTVRTNILTRRREEARATHPPLWQRLRLDLVIAILAIAGYGFTFYLENTQQLLNTQGQILISTPLELLAPLLLLFAGILFFMRLFPLMLRWFARLARRRRGLVSMLALAQMERAPRQAMRMALLLGLASAFTLFALVFYASQGQRAQDLATYQAVSDFSGYNYNLPVTSLLNPASAYSTPQSVLNNATLALQQATAQYRQVPGVSAVSVGSLNSAYLTLSGGTSQSISWPTSVIAVDPATFAQTALWSAQDSSQSLTELMHMLLAQRPQALRHGVVPALVAASTWDQLGLSPGMTFHLATASGDSDPTTYLALAEVKHIPPVDDGQEGAFLVDYQSLVAGQLQGQGLTQTTNVAQLNYVWLRSNSDVASLERVRASLNEPDFTLVSLMDRHALSSESASDPLANDLLSTISVGVAVALLLAFLANLLLPLLSLRMRLTHFAVLRALGTAPDQVTEMLIWELAVVLATALALGLLFGALLAFTSVPPLVFSGALPASLLSSPGSAIYSLQRTIPVTVVLPSSLLLALAALLLLCLSALVLLTWLARRPLMAQALRLNED
jgi:ABC-type antimicrobial peptide transport system permease subunit